MFTSLFSFILYFYVCKRVEIALQCIQVYIYIYIYIYICIYEFEFEFEENI